MGYDIPSDHHGRLPFKWEDIMDEAIPCDHTLLIGDLPHPCMLPYGHQGGHKATKGILYRGMKEANNFHEQAKVADILMVETPRHTRVGVDLSVDPGYSMVDISGPEVVEVVIASQLDGARVWVNVDGVCRFRAYRIKLLNVQNLDGSSTILERG